MRLSFRRVIDLTQTLADGTAVYPGDPPVRIAEACHRDRDGFAVAGIQINDHAGTHLETQYHMMPGAQLIDEPPERLIGRATVVAVQGPWVGVGELAPFEGRIRRTPFVLLYTAYSERVAGIDPEDPRRPVVTLAALEWLCERGMQLLGIDAFDFDSGPPYPGHHYLFERKVLVLEGLVGLRELTGRTVTLVVAPLKVAGTGASPCRVLALVE